MPDASAPVLYIAGDVHLSGGEHHFAGWLDWLATRPAARLVLLGDLFDYWLDSGPSLARYAPVLARLRGLAARGWRLDLVRGNRELVAGRLLAVASRCALRWPALDVALGPRRVRIVHGDRLCFDPGYRMYAALVGGFWMRGLIASAPAAAQESVARFFRWRSQARQRRRRAVDRAGATPRDRVFIDRRRVQAAARGADTLVAGHIHQAWRRTIGGVDLILVGDWPAGVARWVEGFGDGRLVPVARIG